MANAFDVFHADMNSDVAKEVETNRKEKEAREKKAVIRCTIPNRKDIGGTFNFWINADGSVEGWGNNVDSEYIKEALKDLINSIK